MIRSLFIFLCFALLSAEELVVVVPTQKQLQPIYLCTFQAKDTPFTNDYVKQLESVLSFDFEHNGRTRICAKDAKTDRILADEHYQQAFYPKIWQDLSVAYVIKARIVNKQLLTSVYVTSSSVVKHFKPLDLSGRLCDDRHLVHRLADGIFLELFKTKGIASSQILYAYQPSLKSNVSDIWECDYDGANAHPISRDNALSITPTSLNSDHFLYACYKSGQTKIFLGRPGAKGSPCIQLSGSQFHPIVNRSGTSLAFTSDHMGRNDLYLQPLSNGAPHGKPMQLYAYPKSVTASPSFSPDGKKIAFVSDQSGNPKIYLIDVPTNAKASKRPTAELLTSKHNACVCPTFSPDGSKIAYSAKIDGVRQVWLYNMQTKETKQLTTGPRNKENPAWAENSLHLIYNTTDGDVYDLFLIHLNDPTPVKISESRGLKHYPSWVK